MFQAQKDKFLGHVITTLGIEAYPEKVEALLKVETPKTIKDIQILNGRLVALARFLAKSTEQTLSFFQSFKKHTGNNNIIWLNEADVPSRC